MIRFLCAAPARTTLLSIDHLYPTTIWVQGPLKRAEAASLTTALRSLAAEPVIFVSFVECTYVDLAGLCALIAHDALQAAPLVVIAPPASYVRLQFRLSGLDCRLGLVDNFVQAYARAGRLRLLADLGERARQPAILHSTV